MFKSNLSKFRSKNLKASLIPFTRSLISDKARCFNQSERALYGNFIINANELLVRIKLAFQKLQTRQTRRNNTKLYKKRFGYDCKHCLETHKLTRYQSEEFSYLTNGNVYAYNGSANRNYSFKSRNKKYFPP